MKEVVDALKEELNKAPKGKKVVTIHLFGIRHAKRLEGINLKELATRSGIGESYGTELHKGVQLAKYVKIKA